MKAYWIYIYYVYLYLFVGYSGVKFTYFTHCICLILSINIYAILMPDILLLYQLLMLHVHRLCMTMYDYVLSIVHIHLYISMHTYKCCID